MRPSASENQHDYFHPELETLSRSARDEYLGRRLAETAVGAARDPWARDRFRAAGLDPDRIRSAQDLEVLPPVSLPPAEDGYPPGRPGAALSWAQALFAAGVRSPDVALNIFGPGQAGLGREVDLALGLLGGPAALAGPLDPARQLALIRELGADVCLGSAGALLLLAGEMEASGLEPSAGLDLVWTAGPGLSAEVKAWLADRFQAAAASAYGRAGLGCLAYECRVGEGLHFSDHALIEVLEPGAGRPLGPGETGRVAATVFDAASPLIRIDLGDLAAYVEEPCACGRTSPRLFLADPDRPREPALT